MCKALIDQFSTTVTLTYIPTDTVEEFQLLHVFANT